MSQEKEASDAADALRKEFEQGYMDQRGVTQAGSTNSFNTVSNPVNVAGTSRTFSTGGPSSPHPNLFIPANTLLYVDQDDSQIPNLEETAELQSTGIFNSTYDDDLDKFASLVKQSEKGIFISQDKYVAEILKNFDFSSVKTTSTPIETQKPLVKDENQMLDYGFNFMNTKIYIDNESTICIVKNQVYHLKTKHIEIRHHFIRDSYEKKLTQVLKIHTDDNVADLLTKAFDVSRFNFLKANIGMPNL
nr:putative ribonuclease H-like domain-containing protein [Tanacetum cinerariifolium]